MATATATRDFYLTEEDIPGASLCGRKPSELKNQELKFWLRCRGDPAKGLKTKAELVKRYVRDRFVYGLFTARFVSPLLDNVSILLLPYDTTMLIFRVDEYLNSGKDKNIVDPDPNGLYTKRKEQRDGATSKDKATDLSTSSDQVDVVNYPESGWGTSLAKLPFFTRAEMDKHIARSGKNIGNKDHHSVPTALRKAKTFLEDEYLHEIMGASDDKCFYFKAKCCHSYRKNDPPHQLKLSICILMGEVLNSSCTCVAGKVGFCNHISALMLKVCKFSLYKAKTTKELQKEEDENPQLACTSQLQQWNKKGGGTNIVPQPVMEVVIKKTKLEEPSTSRGSSGVKCLLYEARKQPNHDADMENMFLSELEKLDPNLGFAHINKARSQDVGLTKTKFGENPVGSYLSYQTSFTESNFSAHAELTSVPRIVNGVVPDLTHYPRFPLMNEEEMVLPRELTETEQRLLSSLNVDEEKINEIESSTRAQSNSDIWKKERTYRFTASSFQLIAKRQRNHETFAQSIMHPKPFSSKYVAHGMKYEPIALQEYQKFMFNQKTPVAVLRSGFVVSKSFPILGASPDAKVIDKGCTLCFGLGEVKCPYTKFHVTPLEACSDPKFFMEKVSDSNCRLKRDHEYYAQVQGQMGVTGAKWCDFIVYTSKGLYVERIPFDPVFWQNLRSELLNYYFTHFISFAAEDNQKSLI